MPDIRNNISMDVKQEENRGFCNQTQNEQTIEVTNTETKCLCKNYQYGRKKYVKIPVVLAEFTVQIDTEADITLPEDAIDIKFIDKNVYLTQCHLIPGTNKVYLSGYVRKNIVYSTLGGVTGKGIAGNIRHATLNVPFDCVTEVCFERYPKIYSTPPKKEVEFLDCKKPGKNMKEDNYKHVEIFNERVYCELENAYIYETDIKLDSRPVRGFETEEVFRCIKEKMVVYVTIKLLQNQQVCWDGPVSYEEDEEEKFDELKVEFEDEK
ncbi:CsxC family protein [Caloramator proteoclasticus]|uniref:DUF7852 domain-containing protein n=1 Tax=Caloramator proteoclasticus DSM 10124 TaxID=1121262 RepID=A0A1M4S749_9CLOT|nr:hypothetical protein [Caloramator proteoclasticus]SHE28008.1 hypothetical protein SAMN02746091_00031 [Caloramator proteoclasticus DSM 10124]